MYCILELYRPLKENWIKILGNLNTATLKHMYSIYCTRNNQPTWFLLFSRNWRGAMSFALLLNYSRGIACASSQTLFANTVGEYGLCVLVYTFTSASVLGVVQFCMHVFHLINHSCTQSSASCERRRLAPRLLMQH